MEVFTLKPYTPQSANQYQNAIKFLNDIASGTTVANALDKIILPEMQKPASLPKPDKLGSEDSELVFTNASKSIMQIWGNIYTALVNRKQFEGGMVKSTVQTYAGYLKEFADIVDNNQTLKTRLLKTYNMESGFGWVKNKGGDVSVIRSFVIIDKNNKASPLMALNENDDINKTTKQQGYPIRMAGKNYSVIDIHIHMLKHAYFIYAAYKAAENNIFVSSGRVGEVNGVFFTENNRQRTDNMIVKKQTALLVEILVDYQKNVPLKLEIEDIRGILETIETHSDYITQEKNTYNHEAIECDLIQPLRNCLIELKPENFGIMGDTMEQLGLVGEQQTDFISFAKNEQELLALYTKKYHAISIATHIVEAYQMGTAIEESVIQRLEAEWPSDYFC